MLSPETLDFPLSAKVLGELVEVVDLGAKRSSSRRGIVARVRKGGQDLRSRWQISSALTPIQRMPGR